MAGTSTIREFLVGLGFNVDESGLAKFKSSILAATGVAVALGTAVTVAAGAILAGVKSIAEEYDQLDKLATRFRSTADAVDEFGDIAQVLGLTKEQSIGSLTALDRAIGDTALGLGRAKKVFEEIGLEVLDATGKMRPTTEVMDELGSKLKDMERGKAIAVMERLGLDPALMKVFNADLGQLREDLAAIDKAAGFDLTEAVDESKKFMKSWRSLSQELAKGRILFSKSVEAIAVKIMPRISEAIDGVTKRISTMRKAIMDNMEAILRVMGYVVNFIINTFAAGWRLVGRVLDLVGSFIGLLVGAFKSLDGTVQIAILAALGLAAAWRLVNLGFLASPITWIVALGAALLLLYDDFLTWQEGGESLIDWGAWSEEIALVTGLMTTFRDFLTNAFTLIFAAVDLLAKLLTGDFSGAWRAAGEAVDSIIAILKSAYEWISLIVGGIGKITGLSNLGGKLSTAADATFATGQYDAAGNFQGGALPVDPSAGVAQNVTQSTTIQVQGGSDPAATGRAVAGEQGRVNADMTRNMKAAAR
jgi:hypothetical protein